MTKKQRVEMGKLALAQVAGITVEQMEAFDALLEENIVKILKEADGKKTNLEVESECMNYILTLTNEPKLAIHLAFKTMYIILESTKA